ncbi:hypothetical protein IQ07DRAFT_644333 [Pyrenochaeta sp. DS3sAY3a]|nr:hypothetical protein IQ07DRAFT_644333 [Pyrenochaeta sp. DS3sAY3a]
MKFLTFASLLVVGGVAQESFNLQSAMSLFNEIAPQVTKSVDLVNHVPTRLGNVDAAPKSLWGAIFTGIPQSVIVELLNPQYVASYKSNLAAGNTPSWYAALPTDLQAYLVSINRAIATGGNAYTGTEVAPTIPGYVTPGSGRATSAPPNPGNGNAAATSSKGGAAPAPTWGAMEVVGLSGAVGILGLALGL